MTLPPWLSQPHFGRTNAFVSEEQKQEVHLYLQSAQDALQDLRDRIKELQGQEEDLIVQIDRCKVAIAPHKQLPADVLRYTFAICIDKSTVFPLSKNNMLLVLSQVCSSWRKITHETPSFWSAITIVRHPARDCRYSSPQLRSSLDLWVNHAAGQPLSLKVYEPEESLDLGLIYPEQWKRFKKFVISLLSCLDYCKLEIRIDLSTLLEFKSHIPTHRMRQLEELSLVNTYSGPFSDLEDLSFPPGIAFERLTSLKLNGGWDLRSGHVQTIIPWKSIRRLALLHPLPPVVCLEILQQTGALEDCHMVPASGRALLISKSTFMMAEVKHIGVRLQHLRTLHISSIEARDAETFMDQLVLPALEYVVCDRYESRDVRCGMLDAVMRLARRSGTQKVKGLDIYDSPFGNQFQFLLRSMPHLQVIRFTKSTMTFDDDTLERLSTGELGPCLNVLEAGFAHDGDKARVEDILRRRRERPRAVDKEITASFPVRYFH